MKESRVYNIIKLFLIVFLMMAIVAVIGEYIKGMDVNKNNKADIVVTSDFLQMQLEDPVVLTERNFIGKLHFEVEIPQETFEAKNNTKSKFVKNWFSDKNEVMILEERNDYVIGDFDFVNSVGYEGDDYTEHKDKFRSEIFFNENGYRLNIPSKAIEKSGRIKEDFEFKFVITVQTVRIYNENALIKSGVIIQRDFEFKFNVINNGIISFINDGNGEVNFGQMRSYQFRETLFDDGKIIKSYRSPWKIITDLFDKFKP